MPHLKPPPTSTPSPIEAAALKEFIAASRERVKAALDECLPAETQRPTELHRALRYAVFSGGKRLRPTLAFGTAVAGAAP